ncbi:hypothetical protein IRY61_02270 [Candidatus Saccharibacteria bacterium]|nr:hypothetical protein [Candidatus Saccharibacteria bacterium]
MNNTTRDCRSCVEPCDLRWQLIELKGSVAQAGEKATTEKLVAEFGVDLALYDHKQGVVDLELDDIIAAGASVVDDPDTHLRKMLGLFETAEGVVDAQNRLRETQEDVRHTVALNIGPLLVASIDDKLNRLGEFCFGPREPSRLRKALSFLLGPPKYCGSPAAPVARAFLSRIHKNYPWLIGDTSTADRSAQQQ